jgi:hypothetical protein
MSNEETIHLVGVDQATLLPIVRQVTQRDHGELVDWHYQPLEGGVGDLGAGLVGIYRLAGHISDAGIVAPWSLVLKSAQGNTGQDEAAYLLREWQAYRSGFLNLLSGDVVAPKCFGTSQQAGDVLWIWLEDLGSVEEQPWAQEDYERTARDFGAWNGSYLVAETQPNFAWFCQSAAREWTQQAAPEIEVLRASLGHPVIERLYPGDQAQRVLHLWEERNLYLNALERLPQTVCHNDAFRRNLFIRRHADRPPHVIAIDWAYLGWGAVGEEVAAMVVGNLVFNEVAWAQAPKFTEAVFAAYLEGLQQTGWSSDPRMVRLGFTAAAAMKYSFPYGLSSLFTVEGQAWYDKMLKQEDSDTAGEMVEKRRFIFDLAAEARSLIEALGV